MKIRRMLSWIRGETGGEAMGEANEKAAPAPGAERGDAQLAARVKSLEARIQSLERRMGSQRGLWAERAMYWLIVVGLIIAIIMLN